LIVDCGDLQIQVLVFDSAVDSSVLMADALASGVASMGMSGTGALVVAHGELLIDFVPTVAGVSLAEAPAFKKAPGGAPANVAVGVARLGGNAAFVGKVGDDEFGSMLADVLKDNNVNVKGLRFDPHARTALAFVTLKKCGEREFMFFRNPSADMLMVPAELDERLIRQSSVFHYGSISLISEPSRSTHMAAMKIAQESGSLMSYDPNLRLPLWPSPEAAREGILSIWSEADIVKVSDEEVKFLTNGGDDKRDEVVMTLWHEKMKLLLVTDGPDGCRYYTPGFKGRVNSFKVATIDTTGAGDAFVAGLLHQLANNKDLLSSESALKSALHFACACGAITTTERGAIPAMPDKPSVEKFMESRKVM
jgi:fructokinase